MECMEGNTGNSINAWIIRLMHRYSSVNFMRFMELGVHPGQLPVLKMVYSNEGANLRELAEMLHIKPPTVTVTVQRLEKAGLVCKKPDDADLRVNRIYLTEKGKSIHKEIMALIGENEKILTAGFTEEELQQLYGYFRRMIDNLAQADKDGKKLPDFFSREKR